MLSLDVVETDTASAVAVVAATSAAEVVVIVVACVMSADVPVVMEISPVVEVGAAVVGITVVGIAVVSIAVVGGVCTMVVTGNAVVPVVAALPIAKVNKLF